MFLSPLIRLNVLTFIKPNLYKKNIYKISNNKEEKSNPLLLLTTPYLFQDGIDECVFTVIADKEL